MKRSLIIVLIVVIAFVCGWLANDVYTFSDAMKHDAFADYKLKPKNVPRKAFWAGGVDGGNWYLVKEINALENKATIEVYSDQDGSLLVSKTFISICEADDQVLSDNLKELINGFDGEKIILTSKNGRRNCYLK